MPISFWRLPAIARAEANELIRWAALGLGAARCTAEAKAKPKGKAKGPKKAR
jgi:hypothetical protein